MLTAQGHSAVTVLVTPVSVYCPLYSRGWAHRTQRRVREAPVPEGHRCVTLDMVLTSSGPGFRDGKSDSAPVVGSDENTAPHPCPRASCRPASGGQPGLSSWAFSCSPAPAGCDLGHTAFCSLGQVAPSTSQGGPAGDTPICRGWHTGRGGGGRGRGEGERWFFCFTDGETEAQRGRGMWSNATAGVSADRRGVGPQPSNSTPVQCLDGARGSSPPGGRKGGCPLPPIATRALYPLGGCCEGRRGRGSCGVGGLMLNPSAARPPCS